MISAHPNQSLSVGEFKDEIENLILQERLKTLVGHLHFLLNSPEHKWKFDRTRGIIRNPHLSQDLLNQDLHFFLC